MDFSNWDGKSPVCFRDDDEGDGFADEKCQAQPNEDDGVDMDEDLESVNQQPRFLQSIGWLMR